MKKIYMTPAAEVVKAESMIIAKSSFKQVDPTEEEEFELELDLLEEDGTDDMLIPGQHHLDSEYFDW